ncbi:MAG: Uma2 family endonuclease, partial [Fimbriiglobus sp.]
GYNAPDPPGSRYRVAEGLTMAAITTPAVRYPDSDGRRMAENTLQAEWIQTLHGNLDLLFADRPDVFVAMDNLWYPVEGQPKRRAAPDVYVAFGRPKGRRGSYKQWEESGIPPTVVFEVLSPGNRHAEMRRKFRFYERYGADEYYIIDPDGPTFEAWHRTGGRFRGVKVNGGLVSPRLGVRFAWQPWTDVVITYPDGKPFLSFLQIGEARDLAEQQARAAEQQARAAEQQARAAEQQARELAGRVATAERDRDAERDRAAALAAKLRALGIDPDAV